MSTRRIAILHFGPLECEHRVENFEARIRIIFDAYGESVALAPSTPWLDKWEITFERGPEHFTVQTPTGIVEYVRYRLFMIE